MVSAFAVLGDMLKPKSFSGLLGAAPSVAMATLGLSMAKHGAGYGAVQGSTMMFGAIGLLAYSIVAAVLIRHFRVHAWAATLMSMPVWFLAAFGLFHAFGGGAGA